MMENGLSERKYEFLEHLSVEELESLLRSSSDSEQIEAFYDAVTEVIVKKEREHPTGRLKDVNKAWEEFQTVYNAPREEKRRDSRELEAFLSVHKARRISFSLRRVRRIAAIAAISVTLLLTLMIGAQAIGLDVFGALANWTEGTFRIVTGPRERDETIALPNMLQGAIGAQEILGEYAPAWYPEGAKTSECSVQEDDHGASAYVSFSLPENRYFSVSVDWYRDSRDIDSLIFERDDTLQEEYVSGSRTYYIFSNYEHYTAVWSDGTAVLLIHGNITMEELKAIVDSIGG